MIKNECHHAYKMLHQAECLWCEDCVEKKIKEIQKPKVSREDLNFLLSLINEDYFQLHGSVGMKQFEQKYEQHIIEFLKEAGVEVEK